MSVALAMVEAGRVEYAMGIGRLSGLTVFEVPAKGPDAEVNYEKKAKMIFEALEEKDFVCCYVNACDEAAWEGDFKAKVSALEGIDFFILSRVKEYLDIIYKHQGLAVCQVWEKVASMRGCSV